MTKNTFNAYSHGDYSEANEFFNSIQLMSNFYSEFNLHVKIVMIKKLNLIWNI